MSHHSKFFKCDILDFSPSFIPNSAVMGNVGVPPPNVGVPPPNVGAPPPIDKPAYPLPPNVLNSEAPVADGMSGITLSNDLFFLLYRMTNLPYNPVCEKYLTNCIQDGCLFLEFSGRLIDPFHVRKVRHRS